MNIWWANINSRHESRSFWEHEWSKHGVTGNWGEDGAQNYFLDGIRSRQNIDLLFILRSGGIRFNTYYTKRHIVGAIRKWLPVQNIYISCSGRPGGFYYLHEIFICLDHNLNYISCPLDSNPRRCFGDFFQIPSTWMYLPTQCKFVIYLYLPICSALGFGTWIVRFNSQENNFLSVQIYFLLFILLLLV